jgi:ECF sigma factor
MVPEPVTQLLADWGAGDRDALQRLIPIVYDELRVLAKRRLQHEPPGVTLQSTALVHEAYLRLADKKEVDWHDRAHFFAVERARSTSGPSGGDAFLWGTLD